MWPPSSRSSRTKPRSSDHCPGDIDHMTTLVIAEHDNATLKGATLNTITAATQVGGEVHVLVAGSHAGAGATAAPAVGGVGKVLHADSPAHAEALAENLAAQVLAVASNYSHIFFAST